MKKSSTLACYILYMYRGLAVLLIGILACAGLLHSLIPHSHGEEHESGMAETVVWASLHSAVLQDSKKAPLLPLLSYTLTLLVVCTAFALLPVCTPALARVRDKRTGECLRRGINKYRSFG